MSNVQNIKSVESASTTVLTLAHVTRVGTDENFKGGRAAAVVASVPEGYDWTARGAVSASILAALGIEKSEAPAQKRGPKGAQTETTFGVGFRVLSDAIRSLVKESKVAEPGVIRLSLSGTGGATVTLRVGDAGYDVALAMIEAAAAAADSADESSAA